MSEALWALGRGSGIAALVLLTLAVASGILTRSGRPLLTVPRFGVVELHRSTALLGSIFVAIHIASLFFDPYAQLNVVDTVIPFAGAYKPFWLGLGTLAFDLLIAVTLTGVLRHRLGHRTFRAVHWLSYALWPVALAHALGNGTDSGSGWFLTTAFVCAVIVSAATTWRLRDNFQEHQHTRVKVGR
ncbi:ferric reductase-like transmembrane domain-containing protein [Rhodococcus sp. AW25M09]|uniref:ferric reductase-like transmembrane domain-containing protein n=1 Tax=Rhodococcus sp. AW25M09 TaxID=1268303 RepID=UPI000348995D|nr:ferric reductase-like transmembrane domain-containing protein [Rhodococcus sp. AW25M09]